MVILSSCKKYCMLDNNRIQNFIYKVKQIQLVWLCKKYMTAIQVLHGYLKDIKTKNIWQDMNIPYHLML